jgi:hypothetical protein
MRIRRRCKPPPSSVGGLGALRSLGGGLTSVHGTTGPRQFGKSLLQAGLVSHAAALSLARLAGPWQDSASRTISSNKRIQNMLRGVASASVTTTPVLCATKAGQLIYTVRLQVPAAAMTQLRSTTGTQLMRTVYTATTIRTLKLSGGVTGCTFSVITTCWMGDTTGHLGHAQWK